MAKALLFLWLIAFAIGSAFAQHPPEHQALHEQFYSTWMIPPSRTTSCCNKQDCFPTTFRKRADQWWALDRDGLTWLLVPADKIEENQTDPRDSPDGRGHICAYRAYIYCAVLGSGT